MSFIESFLAMVLGKLVLYAMRSAQRRTNGDTFRASELLYFAIILTIYIKQLFYCYSKSNCCEQPVMLN